MRYAIFSDIHGNLEAFEAVINAYKSESIDKYMFLGDVVGYGANPRECIEKLRNLAQIFIAGNHDYASVDLFPLSYFTSAAKEALTWTINTLAQEDKDFLKSFQLKYEDQDVTLVHGTLEHPDNFDYMITAEIAMRTFELLKNNICFVGHSHVAGIFVKDKANRLIYLENTTTNIEPGNKYIVNVGSVGQPRDHNPQAAYCIYDTATKQVEIKRLGYDVDKAKEKIIQAGLPQYLGDRLTFGR